jgi:DNA-binding CsgD family transcriptional regulator
VGRRAEREAVEQVLARARAGRSEALVVRGEAGIGKTALLEQALEAAAASGFRVESCAGVEAEAQFAFAGLHQLCSPMLGRLDQLPGPQRAALGVAFGLRAGPAPDRFLVGLATLTLVAEVAEERPLLCLVDDGQWLDEASAQVLAFVARRVSAEQVALLFGVRDADAGAGAGAGALAGLPELRLTGLGDADARALLGAVVREPLDDGVRDQVLAEARGNPLALLELPRNAQPARLGGGFELPDALKVPRRVEDGFRRRSAQLPAETQLLLLVAAADPTGEAALLWRAADHLGIDPGSAAPAEQAELLEIDTRVRFRHPLVRSAVYQAATSPDRRRAHDALAAATDPDVDPDRRAWHRAQAVLGTDEDAASDLERSADRARARGGLAAAAAFLQRAVELTPDPATRAARALEAAQATHAAGASDTAAELLAAASTGALDELHAARVALLGARIAFHTTGGSQVPGMLVDAARTLTPLDASLARETYLEAIDAALVTGGRETVRAATAALAAPDAAVPLRPSDLLMDGLVTTFTAGYAAGAPALRLAMDAFRNGADAATAPEGGSDRWLWLASRIAVGVLDDDAAHVLASRNVQLARETGALAMLPAALSFLTSVLTLTGELARAGELADESTAIARATGAVPLLHGPVMLAAWRGDHTVTARLTDTTLSDPAYPDDGGEVAVAQYAMAVLHNGLGRYDDARTAAERACETDEPALTSVTLPELVEAAVRADQPDVAAGALEQLSSRALACDTSWALGLEARSRALTSAGPTAEDNYREAVERLGRSRMTGETARAHLVYGEWLRREGRRQDAREQLRTAHALLSDMGAEAFAARAARELRATGERARTRGTQPSDALTAHEAHIARLVGTGATSREVAAQLFLSPRTVEAHLRSIFRKLGITSRRQLRELRLPT